MFFFIQIEWVIQFKRKLIKNGHWQFLVDWKRKLSFIDFNLTWFDCDDDDDDKWPPKMQILSIPHVSRQKPFKQTTIFVYAERDQVQVNPLFEPKQNNVSPKINNCIDTLTCSRVCLTGAFVIHSRTYTQIHVQMEKQSKKLLLFFVTLHTLFVYFCITSDTKKKRNLISYENNNNSKKKSKL